MRRFGVKASDAATGVRAHHALLSRVFLAVLASAVVMCSLGFLGTAAAAAEEEAIVPVTEETESEALYTAMTYAQLTSPTAPEEHINGTVAILETALLDTFDEIAPVSGSQVPELEELFGKIHIEPSREENLGTLFEDFVKIAHQLGVGTSLHTDSRSSLRADAARPALTKLTNAELQEAVQTLGQRLKEIHLQEALLYGNRITTVDENFWRKEYAIDFAVRYLGQADVDGRSDVDFTIVDDAMLPTAGTDASLASLVQRAINSGYRTTAAEAQLMQGGLTVKQMQEAQVIGWKNLAQVQAPAADQVFVPADQPPPPLPQGQAALRTIATDVDDDESESDLIDNLEEEDEDRGIFPAGYGLPPTLPPGRCPRLSPRRRSGSRPMGSRRRRISRSRPVSRRRAWSTRCSRSR